MSENFGGSEQGVVDLVGVRVESWNYCYKIMLRVWWYVGKSNPTDTRGSTKPTPTRRPIGVRRFIPASAEDVGEEDDSPDKDPLGIFINEDGWFTDASGSVIKAIWDVEKEQFTLDDGTGRDIILDAYLENLDGYEECFDDGIYRRCNTFKEWHVGRIIPKHSNNLRSRTLAAKAESHRIKSEAPSIHIPTSSEHPSVELIQHEYTPHAVSELSALSPLPNSPFADILKPTAAPCATVATLPEKKSKSSSNKCKPLILSDVKSEEEEPPLTSKNSSNKHKRVLLFNVKSEEEPPLKAPKPKCATRSTRIPTQKSNLKEKKAQAKTKTKAGKRQQVSGIPMD
ncbi:hypothetical protein K439DRAFT_1624302 [Ramaria rubella]|nr:hypothetical protein K439DRAFT_1624302 [Ramaria rubella]